MKRKALRGVGGILAAVLVANGCKLNELLEGRDAVEVAPDSGEPDGGGTAAAAALVAKLGRPGRLLIGLGGGASDDVIRAQGITIDLFERYLVGLPGSGGWTEWNDGGSYVNLVAGKADSLGAVPMFTLYQMATWGDGNLEGLADRDFMAAYWDTTELLFERLAIYDKVALVHFEPDFWGYAQRQSPGGDPKRMFVHVRVAAACVDLPEDVTGMGRCLVRLARRLAPKVLVGFSPSRWGAEALAEVVRFMGEVGTGEADFVVVQTLDRDAGCFEAQIEPNCRRAGRGWYWDETNTRSPHFREHFAEARALGDGLGKPLLWWQTPLGVPAAEPGGSPKRYRDNRVRYFLSHPEELVGAGGFGVVFGAGATDQTDLTTDGGQFRTAAAAYLARPALLR